MHVSIWRERILTWNYPCKKGKKLFVIIRVHTYEVWLKYKRCFKFFQKVFINNPLVPFKVNRFRYNTLIPTICQILEIRDLKFKVISEQHIFYKIVYGNFIEPQNFCQISAERKSPKIYFLNFFFDGWTGARILALRLISQHTIH